MNKRILVTGLTGFVGQNLKAYLKDKYQIVGISRNETKNLINYKDLTIKLLNDSKTFIHLAGKAHDLKKTSQVQEYFTVNTELTKKVFDQFLESKCETFIYMSSVKAIADEVIGELTEDVKPNPKTAYGKSKLEAEKYILNTKLPENKRVYILRPCMIHGPKNKGNLNLLYKFVSKGIPYPFGKYKNKRSFLSVKNLCFVIKELIENKNILNGVYNVSDNEPLSTNKLVVLMSEAINSKPKVLNLPKAIINTIAKIGDFIPIPINSERVKKLTESYIVSNHKLINTLQKKLPLNASEGIVITIKSFKKE